MIRLFLALTFALTLAAQAQQLSPLAPKPDWTSLEQWQGTITREEFVRAQEEVYLPNKAGAEWLEVGQEGVTIRTEGGPVVLRFAAAEGARPTRYWRSPAQLPPPVPGRPLEGLKVAIDPGHLGGEWARMEERYFRLGESRPITEGDLTLRVATTVAPALRALGAEVALVRSVAQPVTMERPETLWAAARAELAREGFAPIRDLPFGPGDPLRGRTVQGRSELLFYRNAEIRARAKLVNETIRPDVVLCLHFNAEAWGDPLRPDFVPRNHLHVLANGSYSAAELAFEDIRFDMLTKLLTRCDAEEWALGGAVAKALAEATGLPAYTYTTPNAKRLDETGYLWARNLLANRLYHCPVIFTEPYVMNCEEVWARVQLGDYEGEIALGGKSRASIFREYAGAVVKAVVSYYEGRAGVAPSVPGAQGR